MVKREAFILLAAAILSFISLANCKNSITYKRVSQYADSCRIDDKECMDRCEKDAEKELKELNEMIEELESKHRSEKIDFYERHHFFKYDEYDELIENLNHIKNELKRTHMDKMERKLERTFVTHILAIHNVVDEMRKQNNCPLATRVSKVLLKLFGKFFQANCDKSDMTYKDRNNNGCDWYGELQNYQECGEHDMLRNFSARKMCCACREIPENVRKLSRVFTEQILQCYLVHEKHEDYSGVLQGTLDIIDEFVHAFGKNAKKNINVQYLKMDLLIFSGDRVHLRNQASDDLVAKNFYDLAMNIHSRFFEDNYIMYADILSSKVIRQFDQFWIETENYDRLMPNEREPQEAIESLLQCLKIYYEDKKNNKERIQRVHKYLSYAYWLQKNTLGYKGLGELILTHGRIAIKLEKHIYGEIRSNGGDGFKNLQILIVLGNELLDKFVDSKGLKQEFYDETTKYYHEALAIADHYVQSQLLIFASARIYLRLSLCELTKTGKGGVRKGLEYMDEALFKLGKLDQTFIIENPDEIKSALFEIEVLSDLI